MEDSNTYTYPKFARRIQALLIDGIFIPIGALGTIMIASSLGITGAYAGALAVLTVFLLEPTLVSVTGGTLGHHFRGLTVLHPKTKKKLNILTATFRFIVKIPLGWLSLITYFTTKRYQAVHDLASRSVVLIKSQHEVPDSQKRSERVFQDPAYSYPSITRKILVVITYNLIFIVVSLAVVGLIAQSVCEYEVAYCENVTNFSSVLWQLMVFWSIGASIYGCRYGRIWGCKRILKEENA